MAKFAQSLGGSPLVGIEDEELMIVEAADLTDRQRMFVLAYMRTRNTSRAAEEAGYERRPRNDRPGESWAGTGLMQKPKIKETIAALTRNRMKRLQVTPQWIEERLAEIAGASLARYVRVQEDGTMYHDFTNADAADFAGMSSVKCEVVYQPGDDRDAPRQVLKQEVRLADRLGALRTLAQIHKMIGGDNEVTAVIDVADAIREARKRAGIGDT